MASQGRSKLHASHRAWSPRWKRSRHRSSREGLHVITYPAMARLVQAVIEALEEVFGETGDEDFEVVRAAPSWPNVIEAAAAAWKAMSANP